MNILNNRQTILKIDKQNMLGSIEMLSAQILEILDNAKNFKLPAGYKKIKNVVVAGMGGSALPTRIIKSIYRLDLKLPVEISNDYRLPGFVNKDTLVILSSYSGSTEEVLSMAAEAKKKKAKIIVIASGKNLAEMVKKGVPGIVFTTDNNPCGSPRMGLGYALVGQLLIFSALGLVKFTAQDKKEMVSVAGKYNNLYGVETKENLAKRTAVLLKNRMVLFMAAEHLVGNAHVAANQMNENNKRLAVSFALPELNHHLLEGMKLPTSNERGVLAVVFNSNLYDERISKRIAITRTILAQNNIAQVEYVLGESRPLSQVVEALVFSSYLSYYGAILEGLDPTAIPYVDFLKKKLKK